MTPGIVETQLSGSYCVSDDPARLDVDLVHEFLSTQAYWALGRARAKTEAAIAGSHCFGVYGVDGQVGFARVVTDYTFSAWLSDLFILPRCQGRGLGRGLVQAIIDHPRLTELGRMMLVTRDAHDLYGKFGFTALPDPAIYMVRGR